MEGIEYVSPMLAVLIEGIGVTWAVRVYWIAMILLTILVYKLGFAKKLSLGKNIVIYICLVIGSLLLLILSFQLPIVESLLVAVAVLGIYKIRLKMHKEEQPE